MKKTVISAVLCVCMILALAACGTEPAMPGTDSNAYNAPQPGSVPDAILKDTAKWFTCNNLTEEELEADGVNCHGMRLVYSGLKDPAIEERINTEIEAVFDRLMDPDYLPAGEGLAEDLAATPGELYRYVSCYTTTNVNNVLSVDLYLNLRKDDEDGITLLSIDEDVPLNFDLNTGEQIRLGDLFLDGMDAESYINDIINDRIENASEEDYYQVDYPMNAPFAGIREDQKFYLISDGGELCIVLDGNVPEFRYRDDSFDEGIYYQTCNVYIDMNGISALSRRFYNSSKSLFESDEKVYCLRAMNFEPLGSRYVSDFVSEGAEMITYGYPDYSELPDSIRSYFRTCKAEAEELAQEVRGIIREQGLTNYDCYGNVSGDVYAYGGYYNVSKDRSYDIYDEEWNCLATDSVIELRTFKGSDPDPISLESVFREGCDIKALLAKAMSAYRDEYYSALNPDSGGEESLSDEEIISFLDESYERINGFTLDADSIYLSCDPLDDIIARYAVNEENYWMFEQVMRCAFYRDLGCENLTIFE